MNNVSELRDLFPPHFMSTYYDDNGNKVVEKVCNHEYKET